MHIVEEKKKEPKVTDCCSYRQCKQIDMKHTQFRSCISNKTLAMIMNTKKYRQEIIIVTSLIVICGFTLQAWMRNSLKTFFNFFHELFKTAWIFWEILRGINFHKFSLTWPGILFFSSSKRGEKKQNKKNRLDFIHPRYVSRRENVFTLNFMAWKFAPVK